MTETIRYTQIFAQDLALGYGTRNVRLANAGVYPLNEIHLATLLFASLTVLPCTNGVAVLAWTAGYPSAGRVWGVTSKILTAPGTSQGLTGFRVGDAAVADRWTRAAASLALAAETDQGDFALTDLPITAGEDILVQAEGGLFDGTGQIELCCYFSLLRHPVA